MENFDPKQSSIVGEQPQDMLQRLERQGSIVIGFYDPGLQKQQTLGRSLTIKRQRTSGGMPIPVGSSPDQIARLEARRDKEKGREFISDGSDDEESHDLSNHYYSESSDNNVVI